MLRTLLTSTVFFVLMLGQAHADQKDPRLPDLFDSLAALPIGSHEAERAQQMIWEIWGEALTASGRVLMREGERQMVEGDLYGAIATFSALTELEPEFSEGWNKRATVHFMIGDYQSSLADINETLALEPRHWGALSGRGWIYGALDDPEQAIIAFEQALEINPHLHGLADHAQRQRQKLQDKEI